MRGLVSIIILNYNKNDDTIDCLKSLKTQTYQNFEVIIVDNGSKYIHYLELKKELEQFVNVLKINIIRIKLNLFFTGGNNKAIKVANGEYICLLNNDTEVMPNFIETMIDFLKNHNDAGMITPKLCVYNNKNYIWFAGAEINFKHQDMIKIRGYWEFDPKNQKYIKITQTGFAAGTALFVKREVIKKIGLLDDVFLMYHEDLDWNLRANKEGYKSYYVPTTIVYHKVQLYTRYFCAKYFYIRNPQIIIWKHAKLKELFIFYIKFNIQILKLIIEALKKKNLYLIYLWLIALWHGFRIGVKRRTNRSCLKSLLKDYKFIKRKEKSRQFT